LHSTTPDPAIDHGLETTTGAVHRDDLDLAGFTPAAFRASIAPMAMSSL
jgi:hypothetical protein